MLAIRDTLTADDIFAAREYVNAGGIRVGIYDVECKDYLLLYHLSDILSQGNIRIIEIVNNTNKKNSIDSCECSRFLNRILVQVKTLSTLILGVHEIVNCSIIVLSLGLSKLRCLRLIGDDRAHLSGAPRGDLCRYILSGNGTGMQMLAKNKYLIRSNVDVLDNIIKHNNNILAAITVLSCKTSSANTKRITTYADLLRIIAKYIMILC